MSKSTSKAAVTTSTIAPAAVKVAADIVAQITGAATTSAAAQAAIRTSDQQVIKLSLKVREDKTLSALFNQEEDGGRSAVQAALKPYFVSAYEKAGQTSVYAVEQLSRVLTLAFGPSGAKVTPKQRAKALAEMDKGLQANANTQAIIALASGRKVYNAKGELSDVKNPHAADRALTPLATMTKAINATVTAFIGEAKGDALPVLITVIEALKASEAIDEDTANTLTSAAQENC